MIPCLRPICPSHSDNFPSPFDIPPPLTDNDFVTQPPLIPTASAAQPLSAEHLRQLHDAQLRSKRIRRAVTVANFDFWGSAIFAALTLLGSIASFSWAGVLVGIGMAIVAWVEYHGARELARLEPNALKKLAYNQLFFGSVLLLYAAYALWSGLRNPSAYSGVLASQLPPDPQAQQMLGSIDDIVRVCIIAIYGTLAFVAITVQGGTALFYLSRRKFLNEYREQTPPWIIEAQRSGMRL